MVESIVPNPQPSPVVVKYGGVNIGPPSPLIDFTVEPIFDDTGQRQGTETRLTLTGSILILPSGSYEQMFVKQEQLRSAFSTDYQDLVILAGPSNKTLAEGTIISSGLRPKVLSINVAPDVQVQRFDYTVELEDSTAASGVSGVVSSFSNQWSFRENPDNCTLEISHTVSAEGLEGEADAFDQAIRRVRSELGIDKLPLQLPFFTEPNASGSFNILHPSNPAGFNDRFEVSVQREETADVANGTYSVTEVFTLVSGVPFYYTTKTASFQEDENGIASVTIQGQVQGLGRTLTPSLGLEGGKGFVRALSGFVRYVRPNIPYEASGVYVKYKSSLIGSGLIIDNPQSTSITENLCRGTIDFSFSYTDDPSARLPSGIASYECNVSRQDGIRSFASHPIPLRRLGPLLQDMKTTTEGQVTINCQAQAKNTGSKSVDTNRAIQFVQDELNRLRHIHANINNFQTLRIGDIQQQSSDTELSANVTITYVFTVDLAAVFDVDSDITLQMLP